jgi:hypothetical protein
MKFRSGWHFRTEPSEAVESKCDHRIFRLLCWRLHYLPIPGSVADYKSFLQTLNSLNLTFTTSELIYLQWQNDVGDPKYSRNAQSMVNGMLFERQQCKILMERFLKASEPYSDAFLKRRENAVVRGWRKVTWLYQTEEISKLERDLQGHMRAMHIYADALFQ